MNDIIVNIVYRNNFIFNKCVKKFEWGKIKFFK